MKKQWTAGLLLITVLLITGCARGETPPAVTATALLESSPEPTTVSLDPTCVPVTQPDPPAELVEIFTPDPEKDWIKGPEDAAVTIVEYADFQCPYCADVGPVLDQLREMYPEDVRIVYRHFPLRSIHDKAVPATRAAEAAGLQGEFWAMHDLLYETQAEWNALSVEEFDAWVIGKAEGLGLDADQFAEDYQSQEIIDFAEGTAEEGEEIGIPGTPHIRINYQQFRAQPQISTLSAIVELIKLEDRHYASCPPMDIDPGKEYTATLKTGDGEIVIRLFPDVAPLAVNSFVFLAEEGWYDGITFHRVIPEFVAQAGDPTGTGYGGPGYNFGIEVDSDLTFDRAGLVAMANSGPENNGSQFFITYGPTPELNGQYTIFGEVIEGLDILEQLSPRDPSQGFGLPAGDELIEVTIEVQ